MCIRLQLTAEQDALLSATLSAAWACFNAVAVLGWERRENNAVTLHQATYGDLRKAHPDLPPQLVVSSRMKATEALRSAFALQKKDEKVSPPHWERGMVRYDARSFRFEKERGVVGLPTVAGRIKFPLTAHRQAQRWLDRADGLPPQTCCGVHLVGGCMWSWMSSHLNSFRPVALSGLISASTDRLLRPTPVFSGSENARKLNNGISGSSANSSPKA